MGHVLGVSAPGALWPAAWPIRMSSAPPQACTLLLLVLFVYDVFFVFITPFLTKVGAPARAPLLHPLLPCPLPDSSSPLLEREQYHGGGGDRALGLGHPREGREWARGRGTAPR